MTRAALILFDDDDPATSVLGVPWPEFRVRHAVRAGAMHIVVVAGRITPQIIAAIDWAKGAGVSVVLARTAIEIADLFHPDETVLLISGPAIVDDPTAAALLGGDGPALLCVAADAGPHWELIDPRARWTGFARLDGAQIRSTAAMVGDWDLGSTLLRQAVGTNAERVMLHEGNAPGRGDNDAERMLASRGIVAGSIGEANGWASRTIVTPIVRLGGTALSDYLAVIARFSPWGAALPLAGAIGFAWCKWPTLAALSLILGFMGEAFGSLAERATGQVPKLAAWRGWFLDGAAVASLAALVLPPLTDYALPVLSVMVVAVTVLFRRLAGVIASPQWLADVPGHAIVIGIASLFGGTGLAAGLAVALIHAFISLTCLQNRLSEALTQAR